MTQQDVEELTSRLTHIWQPQPFIGTSKCIVETDFYSFSYHIEAYVRLLFIIYEEKVSVRLEWDSKCCEMECEDGKISSYWTVFDVSDALVLESALEPVFIRKEKQLEAVTNAGKIAFE